MIRVAFRQAYWKEVQCNVFLPVSWNMEPQSSSLEAWWSLSGCLHGASTVTGSAPSRLQKSGGTRPSSPHSKGMTGHIRHPSKDIPERRRRSSA